MLDSGGPKPYQLHENSEYLSGNQLSRQTLVAKDQSQEGNSPDNLLKSLSEFLSGKGGLYAKTARRLA